MEIIGVVVGIIIVILVFVLLYNCFMLACITGYLWKRLQLSVGANYELDKELDSELNHLLDRVDSGELTVSSVWECTITLSNGDKIWIGNKYYSYGYLFTLNKERVKNHRVRVKTALRVLELERKYRTV